MDEVTYRADEHEDDVTGGVAQHEEKTERLAETPWVSMRAQMTPGEKRRFWYDDEGAACDHFGCGEPVHRVVDLELVAIRSFHDDLPDGLAISHTVHGLAIEQRGVRAPLPTPFVMRQITELRATADGGVVVEIVADCGTERRRLTFTGAQLHARLENAAALALHGRGRWGAAAAGFARAVALDPDFDLASANLASALRDRASAAAQSARAASHTLIQVR